MDGVNFYEILELTHEATLAQIKKAYKKRAKQTHPDVGGDEDIFRAVEEAYRVLSDPDERAFYDANGSARPREAEKNENAGLYQMITNVMNVAIVTMQNPDTDNLIDIMRKSMKETCEQAKKDIVGMGELKVKLARIKKRVTVRTTENIMGALLQNQIDRMDAQIAQAREAIEMFNKGAKFLDDYDYEVILMIASTDLIEALARQASGQYDQFFKFRIP